MSVGFALLDRPSRVRISGLCLYLLVVFIIFYLYQVGLRMISHIYFLPSLLNRKLISTCYSKKFVYNIHTLIIESLVFGIFYYLFFKYFFLIYRYHLCRRKVILWGNLTPSSTPNLNTRNVLGMFNIAPPIIDVD